MSSLSRASCSAVYVRASLTFPTQSQSHIAEDGYGVKNFPSDNSKLAEMEFNLMSDRSGERSRARRGLRGRRSRRQLVGPRHGCGALVLLRVGLDFDRPRKHPLGGLSREG